jgi:PKD repeat protein
MQGDENSQEAGLCKICLESDPSSALVNIDGRDRGTTPLCISLAQGTHWIVISRDGWVPWTGEVTTGRSQTLHLPIISLRPAISPVAVIAANVTMGVAPLSVQFYDISYGDIWNRRWDFGDDMYSSDSAPVHVYNIPGNYTARLEVCGPGGCNLSAQSCLVIVRESSGEGNETSGGDRDGGGTARPGIGGDRRPPVIGGSTGFLEIRCPVEGASVFIDGTYKGAIRNGTLKVLVYLTGTPCRAVTVKAPGYLPATFPITEYPVEGKTVAIDAVPIPIAGNKTVVRETIKIPPIMGNTTQSIPLFSL